ncbi:MAG: hypothetical protein QOI85_1306 [Chloroflexota bacterium]|jgi:hypothetical protein|nr:hypothetical protein [Chloroflexota bacterium]
MDRRERNDLLERLVIYRRAYALRSQYDSDSVLSVKAAIAYAERAKRAARATDATAYMA